MSDQPQPNFVVALDHNGAKVFRTLPARAGASAREISPDAPLQFHHDIVRDPRDADRRAERDEKYPQDLKFFENIAGACKGANHIALIGHGKGQSNEAHHFAAYLKTHHPDLSARVLPPLVADLSHITDAQLIELGHKELHAAAIG